MRRLSTAAGLVVAVLAAGLGVRWFVAARPAMIEANEILDSRFDASEPATEQIRDVVYSVERMPGETGQPRSIAAFVSGRLARLGWSGGPMIDWHARRFALGTALEIRFSDEELLDLYLALLPYEEGEGLADAARFHFGKSASELSARELVRLLAISRSPSRYSPSTNPEAMREMEEILWERYEASRQTYPAP